MYYVYENWTHKRARVHRAGCSYCNNGRGTQPSDSGQNGKWHGPFKDRDDAFAKLKSTGQVDAKGCASCAP